MPLFSLSSQTIVHSITSGNSLGNWNEPSDFSPVAVGNDKITEYVPVWSSEGGLFVMSKFAAGVGNHVGVGDSGNMLTYVSILSILRGSFTAYNK